MEPLQEQVVALTQKVDALHQVIDQVNDRVSEILATTHANANATDREDDHLPHAQLMSHGELRGRDQSIVHKDVLIDSTYITPDRSGDEQSLSAEVQIQRLTAQLTAAYNRIAALEEQLLARRVF
ncbi:MAG: hypothetical protein IGR92_11330 [Leptolyngbyaceae cyanobacterium T60_A2020_046]|nr:hypothetical protein [Leptolyngbyaceae cyanobacterium T60_A2020_046]